MKQVKLCIKSNIKLADKTHKMVLAGDVSAIAGAGQFINIMLDGHYLRRPISISDLDEDSLTIIYKVLGSGTSEMAQLREGIFLDVLTGLGNGYDMETAGDEPLLIGGGIGIPPLYLLAKELLKKDKRVTIILGYNACDEIYYTDEFERLGCEIAVATTDGSVGYKGTVCDAYKLLRRSGRDFSHFYTCGPTPMLKAIYKDVYKGTGIDGQFSFEERMGCGFGACMGCSVMTQSGDYKRICKEGPVLKAEEIYW